MSQEQFPTWEKWRSVAQVLAGDCKGAGVKITKVKAQCSALDVIHAKVSPEDVARNAFAHTNEHETNTDSNCADDGPGPVSGSSSSPRQIVVVVDYYY